MDLWQTRLALLLLGWGVSLLLWGSGLDASLQQWLFAHYHQGFNDFTRLLGWLGLGRNQVIACAAAATWVLWRHRAKATASWHLLRAGRFKKSWGSLPFVAQAWLATLPVFAGAGLLNLAIKLLVGRPRPKEVFWNGLPYGDFYPFWTHGNFDSGLMSWPSGHAASTFAIGTLLMLAFPRWRWPLLALMTLLAASRFLALTPHYLGDVVAGATLGAVVALTLASLMAIKPR